MSRSTATRAPRILVLGQSWPHGRSFGGQLRALAHCRALARLGPVSVTVVGTDANDQDSLRATATEFDVVAPVQPVVTPNQSVGDKLRWALDTDYLNVHGLTATPTERQRILGSLPDYDLVWLLNARTPNILGQWRWPNAHLDVDDVPSTYLRSLAAGMTNPISRLRARTQQWMLHRRELRLRERFVTLSVCSEPDRQYLGGGDSVHVIPNGFEASESVPRSPNGEPRIGFIGLFSYAPNAAGMKWFIAHCWPLISAAVPGVRLRLIGKGSDAFASGSDNIDALGWVKEPSAEIATWNAMVVPIRFGGGTRIKIAEGFSRKCPVVSTSLGAFGYEVAHDRELLLADDPAAFAHRCIELIRSPEAGRRLADTAWRAFEQNWSWKAIEPKVVRAAEDCLRRINDSRVVGSIANAAR